MMIIKNLVSLEFYNENHHIRLTDYHLSEEQLQYTSLPLPAIAKCNEETERYPIVILYKGEPAGFFVLHGWDGVKAYWDNQDAILIRAYSINPKFQGKGIASESLKALDPFINQHFLNKKEIILAVNHQNVQAQHVYKKAGFHDTGIRVIGRNGEMFIMHKILE
ncbi:GNAT family N-acetyltransferase [Rossellomorea sp. y25]|uniref:GNAT family N-acetyltransferase n=1 Tax=Rossellomorea sp. y25 TaxID=3118174 RepID=UPI0030DE1581